MSVTERPRPAPPAVGPAGARSAGEIAAIWEEVLGVADAAMYEAKQKRNAWTGIEGMAWDGDGDELCRAIKTSPGDLAEDGHIRAVESVEDVAEALA